LVAPENGTRAEIVSVEGEVVTVRVSGENEDERRLLAGAIEHALTEIAPEANVVFEGADAPPLDSGLFALDPQDRPS
jgi:hypothetical protein